MESQEVVFGQGAEFDGELEKLDWKELQNKPMMVKGFSGLYAISTRNDAIDNKS